MPEQLNLISQARLFLKTKSALNKQLLWIWPICRYLIISVRFIKTWNNSKIPQKDDNLNFLDSLSVVQEVKEEEDVFYEIPPFNLFKRKMFFREQEHEVRRRFNLLADSSKSQ